MEYTLTWGFATGSGPLTSLEPPDDDLAPFLA